MKARVELVRSGDQTRIPGTHERTCVGAANALTNWASQTDRQTDRHTSHTMLQYCRSTHLADAGLGLEYHVYVTQTRRHWLLLPQWIFLKLFSFASHACGTWPSYNSDQTPITYFTSVICRAVEQYVHKDIIDKKSSYNFWKMLFWSIMLGSIFQSFLLASWACSTQ